MGAQQAVMESQQWDTLLAVQRVLGRLDASSLNYEKRKKEIPERRDMYIAQARAFLLAAALLERDASVSHEDVKEACEHDLNTFLAVQHLIPAEWKSRSV